MAKYSSGQYWEFGIITTIVLIVLYRLALVYDYIPDEYRPSALFGDIYRNTKQALIVEAQENSTLGKISKNIVAKLNAMEEDIRLEEERSAREAKIAAECDENPIFRFFMHLGEESEGCTQRNMKLKQATQEVFDSVNKNADPTKSAPAPVTPKAPQYQPYAAPVVTPVQPTPAPTPVTPARPVDRQPVSSAQPESVD